MTRILLAALSVQMLSAAAMPDLGSRSRTNFNFDSGLLGATTFSDDDIAKDGGGTPPADASEEVKNDVDGADKSEPISADSAPQANANELDDAPKADDTGEAKVITDPPADQQT